MNFKFCTLMLPILVGLPFASVAASTSSENEDVPTTTMKSHTTENTLDDDVTYDGPLTIKLGTRVDYQRVYQKSDLLDEQSGFKGNNLMISIQGNITNKFSYRFRQRISQTKTNNNFFDGTDYMWLQYNFNNRWDIRAGKVAIEYGSTEYQRDPSEQYVFSDYWNYPACYLFGVNVGYNLTDNDRFVFQAAESSFRSKENSDLYAYALSWYGNHNWFHTMYSLNLTEYRNGNYICYVSLGNQFDLGQVTVNVDYQNRFTDSGNVFKDMTLRGEVMFRPSDYLNVIGFAVYSSNKTHDLGVGYLPYGSELTRFGGILEFSPIPKIDKYLKIHAGYSYGTGHEGIKDAVPEQNRHLITTGVQWEMDIVSLAKKIWKKN